jgi:hypothetical protein
MAEKSLVFSDKEQARIQEIIIDQDKDEALKYLIEVMDRIKGTAGHACGPKVV